MPSPIEGPAFRPAAASPAARGSAPSARAFALCLLLCAAMQMMENALPRLPVFPWLKLGLSHLVLLPFLIRFGPLPACALLLGRNLLSLVFAAGPLSTFLIGTASGLSALLAGGWVVRAAVDRRLLGLSGAGMAMAALMNLSQLAVVEGLFIRNAAFYFQLAPMLAWSAVSGAAVAALAARSRPVLEALFDERDPEAEPSAGASGAAAAGTVGSAAAPADTTGDGAAYPFLLCLAAMVGLFLLPSLPSQAAALLALLLFSARRGRWRAAWAGLLRAGPWFLYLAWLHLLFGDGAYLRGGLVTREGLEAFLRYGARLASLILLGPHLAAAFPRHWLAGSASPYARGLTATLPLLPGLHGAALGAGRAYFAALRGRGEAGVLRGLADGFRGAMDGGMRGGQEAPGAGRAPAPGPRGAQ